MTAVAPPGGSYDPTRTVSGGLSPEIARLEAQAALSWPAERRALAEAGVLAGHPLVDLGCGSGAVLRRLMGYDGGEVRFGGDGGGGVGSGGGHGLCVGDGLRVGLDADRRLLDHARAAGAPLVAGRSEALPLRSGSVGGIVARYVLQHLDDPGATLAEMHRVLRPGGRAGVVEVDAQLWGACDPSFPDTGSANRKMAAAQAGRGGDRSMGRRLTRLMAAAGFVDVALHPVAVTSDDHPIDEFGVHVGPERLVPLVEDGSVSLADLGIAAAAWERFRRDPDAWIMLLVFVATGRRA